MKMAITELTGRDERLVSHRVMPFHCKDCGRLTEHDVFEIEGNMPVIVSLSPFIKERYWKTKSTVSVCKRCNETTYALYEDKDESE